MTPDEFADKWDVVFMGWLAVALEMRNEPESEVGRFLKNKFLKLGVHLRAMHADAQPKANQKSDDLSKPKTTQLMRTA